MTEILDKELLGIIEPIEFPGLGVSRVLAKIDTGAYSGALHCESIEEVKDENGKKHLKIVPIDPTYPPVLISRYAKVVARSSTGHMEQRYIATLDVVIKGKKYDIRIGLTRRTMMNVKVLVGRRFLRKNNMLVDVTINQELDTDGGRK